MFFFWMIVSMMLPILFFAACLGLMALWMQWMAFRPEVIQRTREKNVPRGEDAIAQMLASRRQPGRQPWESRLDHEVQRLRRRSMGL